MRIRHTTSAQEGVKQNMTPMIDVVFQLLIFFCLTFKVIAPEGDFSVKMPAPGEATQEMPSEIPPLAVKLTADANGQLTQIGIPQRQIPVNGADRATVKAAFATLRQEVIAFVGNDTGPSSIREVGEAEIDADPQLHYRYVIETVTHVSGYRQGDAVIKLLQKIRFKPPRKP
jgi:biopolymer transport protein ExbD